MESYRISIKIPLRFRFTFHVACSDGFDSDGWILIRDSDGFGWISRYRIFWVWMEVGCVSHPFFSRGTLHEWWILLLSLPLKMAESKSVWILTQSRPILRDKIGLAVQLTARAEWRITPIAVVKLVSVRGQLSHNLIVPEECFRFPKMNSTELLTSVLRTSEWPRR